MPVHGLSLLGPKRIRGFVSILRYINPTIIININKNNILIVFTGVLKVLQDEIKSSQPWLAGTNAPKTSGELLIIVNVRIFFVKFMSRMDCRVPTNV